MAKGALEYWLLESKKMTIQQAKKISHLWACRNDRPPRPEAKDSVKLKKCRYQDYNDYRRPQGYCSAIAKELGIAEDESHA